MNVGASNRRGRVLASVSTVLLVGFVASCGGDDDATAEPAELSADAEAGRTLARDSGCAGCHGNDFAGGLGPTWVGLAGSEVELEDGTTVTADDAYLTRAIADPGAERVAGFALEMPANDLSEEEIAQIVAYIRALGEGGG
jgi:cytochrome c oxidase subunit 2